MLKSCVAVHAVTEPCIVSVNRICQSHFISKRYLGQFWAVAGFLNDLNQFNPLTLVWTKLCPDSGESRPKASKGHGLTASGQELYVFGGFGQMGKHTCAMH